MTSINVSKRDFALKAKKLRKNGMVPASVYGGHIKDSISLQLNAIDAAKLVATHNVGSRLEILLDGKKIPVMFKEKSVSPIGNEILHISFQALAADQKVNSVAHVVLHNAEKITAILEQMTMEIPYSALPKDMIDTVDIDTDGMGVGTTVTVADIKELHNDNIELHIDEDEIVFRIVESVKGSKEDEEAEEAAEETTAE